MRIKSIEPPLAHRPRPAGTKISLIVMHATAGVEHPDSSVQNAVDTLRERGLAYHYLIAKDGSIYKCCPSLAQAGHAGSSYGPEEARAGVSPKQHTGRKGGGKAWHFVAGCSVNAYSVGISLVNRNDGFDPYPAAQIRAALELVAQLKAAIPTICWITAHFAVSPHRKDDPRGPGFDLDEFAAACGLAAWRIPTS